MKLNSELTYPMSTMAPIVSRILLVVHQNMIGLSSKACHTSPSVSFSMKVWKQNLDEWSLHVVSLESGKGGYW